MSAPFDRVSVLALGAAAVTVLLLPQPPTTPPAVPATDRFLPASWGEPTTDDHPLYTRVTSIPDRGPTDWTVEAGSSATWIVFVDGEERRLVTAVAGSLRLDASAPHEASGALTLDGGPVVNELAASTPLRPVFAGMGSLPRPGERVRTTWAWALGSREGGGTVAVQRPQPDRLLLGGDGALPIDLSAAGDEPVRARLAAALGGSVVAERVGLLLDVRLARPPVDQQG